LGGSADKKGKGSKNVKKKKKQATRSNQMKAPGNGKKFLVRAKESSQKTTKNGGERGGTGDNHPWRKGKFQGKGQGT